MSNVYDVLKERGFIKQVTHEEELKDLLSKESVKFYIGFDPTADSLHIGHFLQVITMMHMQQAGHVPIFLIGGGTAMVGDPSGRSDMRQMLTTDDIKNNSDKFKQLFSKFIDFDNGKALLTNNAEWLLDLNYVDFLRNFGKHFSVNRMLSAECFKSRLEKGLSFLEFNYMLMQAYDFLELNNKFDCKLQLGGDDQWSNILAGVDLTRRVNSEQVYGMTFTLLTTSDGIKMGKTQKGALWLDPEKTSPYEFYQYWRNVDDADVENCLGLLTFMPMEEVRVLGALEGAEINKAKEVLAFEVTKLVHGEEEAVKAQDSARALFAQGGSLDDVPSTEFGKEKFEEGMDLIALIAELNLVPSRSEGVRIVKGNGLSIDDVKITDMKHKIQIADFNDGSIMIKKGKKTYHRVVIK